MPRVSVAVADRLEHATDEVLASARILALVSPSDVARRASAVVVAPDAGGAAGYRLDGVAVVCSPTIADGLRVAGTLPDPIRIVVVPQSVWRRKVVEAAEDAARAVGRLLRVVPVRKGGAGLLEATNEWGIEPSLVVVVDPGDAGAVVEDPVAPTAEPEP